MKSYIKMLAIIAIMAYSSTSSSASRRILTPRNIQAVSKTVQQPAQRSATGIGQTSSARQIIQSKTASQPLTPPRTQIQSSQKQILESKNLISKPSIPNNYQNSNQYNNPNPGNRSAGWLPWFLALIGWGTAAAVAHDDTVQFDRDNMAKVYIPERNEEVLIEGYRGSNSEGHRPLKHRIPTPWKNRDYFLTRLYLIEGLPTTERIWDLPETSFIFHLGHYLDAKYESLSRKYGSEEVYIAKDKNGRSIAWHNFLNPYYIAERNVIPSKEFYNFVMEYPLPYSEAEIKTIQQKLRISEKDSLLPHSYYGPESIREMFKLDNQQPVIDEQVHKELLKNQDQFQ